MPPTSDCMDIDEYITAVITLRQAERIVVFTGAGMSAESGIPTFRDDDGFWQRFPPEQFATWSGILHQALHHPHRLAEFLVDLIEPIAVAQPNDAHLAAARLEKTRKVTVITQNIDRLHQEAGSNDVQEVHGSLFEIVDRHRHVVHQLTREELAQTAGQLRLNLARKHSALGIARTIYQSRLFRPLRGHRPNLVLFGDELAEPDWSRALEAVDTCDCLISIGTSGEVYPAAMLPARVQSAGKPVISIGPEATDGCALNGRASEILPRLIDDVLAKL